MSHDTLKTAPFLTKLHIELYICITHIITFSYTSLRLSQPRAKLTCLKYSLRGPLFESGNRKDSRPIIVLADPTRLDGLGVGGLSGTVSRLPMGSGLLAQIGSRLLAQMGCGLLGKLLLLLPLPSLVDVPLMFIFTVRRSTCSGHAPLASWL